MTKSHRHPMMPVLRIQKTSDSEARNNPDCNELTRPRRTPLRGICTLALAVALAACGESAAELDGELQGLAVSFSAVSGQYYLYPNSIQMSLGSASTQPLSVLASKDQSGTTDTWNNYLEFSPASSGLQAVFTFTLPSSVTAAQLANLTLSTNYKGQAKSAHAWQFQLYDAAASQWVTLGDNQNAKSWSWSELAFVALGAQSRFVNSARQLKARLYTKSAADDCNIDYLALSYDKSGSTGAPAPAPAPSPGRTRWIPRPGTSWQVQFAGTLDTSPSVGAFDLDLEDVTKATIDQLHSRGTKVICYFSGGSYEDWRSDAKDFPSSVLGEDLDGWPGERWLDVRQLSVLRPIMTRRMDQAVQKGCDAVDSDNMDGYTHNSGFTISYAQQLAYNKMVAEQAHSRGLSIGLKNNLPQVKDLAELYDFAINEQCVEYGECAMLDPFISRSKAVFGIEFTGSKSSVCAHSNGFDHDTLLKRLSLDAYRVSCR